MFTNQAVFYANRKDLIYILALLGVPFSSFVIGAVFFDEEMAFILFGVFFFFV